MSLENLRMGVYGGSFDPVHFGHLRCAFEVQQQLQLDQLRFVPSGNPPHRERATVSAEHRLAMLELALVDYPASLVDTREIENDHPSYSIDTLESIQAENADAELTLIIGTDQFSAFDTWHRWQHLLQQVNLAVMQRPGESLSAFAKTLLAGPMAEKITQCTVTQLEISSSRIRRDLHQGTDVKFLLPYTVRNYIIEHQLYRGSAL